MANAGLNVHPGAPRANTANREYGKDMNPLRHDTGLIPAIWGPFSISQKIMRRCSRFTKPLYFKHQEMTKSLRNRAFRLYGRKDTDGKLALGYSPPSDLRIPWVNDRHASAIRLLEDRYRPFP